MFKRTIKLLTLVAMAFITILSFLSCTNDNDSEKTIPAGRYVEENGIEDELFSFTANGNKIHWVCTVYGEIDEVHDFTYTIKGDKITMVLINEYDPDFDNEPLYYYRNGKKVTIGDITYIKQ